jgi:hypothetical protein
MDSSTTEPTPETPETPAAKQKVELPPRALLILGILGIIAGLVICYLGWTDTHRLLRLRSAKSHVTATVTGTKVGSSTKGNSSLDARYFFKVHGKRYTYTDATGKKNLWASVKRDTWHEAQRTHNIDVVYNPDDPWINQPDKVGGMPILDTMAGMLFGIGIGIAGIYALIKWRRKSDPPDLAAGLANTTAPAQP